MPSSFLAVAKFSDEAFKRSAMFILLDIDGVLVTTPAWKAAEVHTDGFLKFNERAAANLSRLLHKTKASVVLTTTHRVNHTIEQWEQLFRARGIEACSIQKINGATSTKELLPRATEIQNWVDTHGQLSKFVIIDDDLSMHELHDNVKNRWVCTKPLIGLDNDCTEEALKILTA